MLEAALRQSGEFPALRAHALSAWPTRSIPVTATPKPGNLPMSRSGWRAPSPTLQAIARALNIRAMVALLLGRQAQAIRDLREALALEESLAPPSAQTVQSLNHLGTALVFVQDYAGAGEALARTVKLARRGGLRRLESAALTMQGQIALNCGRYLEALETYRQAIEVAGDSLPARHVGQVCRARRGLSAPGAAGRSRSGFRARAGDCPAGGSALYGQLLMRTYLAFTALAGDARPPIRSPRWNRKPPVRMYTPS